MPTFKEVLRAAQVTVQDKTSGRRMREIEEILRKHRAFSGLTPEKATAILEDLGPTFVKMGQIASNRSDIIPKAYADAFKTLRANVSPVPFDVIISTVDDSLGHAWQETFADIEGKPLGSASVAQVHRARLGEGLGEPVAAHADLAHDQIAALAGEIFKAQRRDHLKLRRLLEDRVSQGLDVLRDAADLLVGDLHAIDLDALVEPDEEGAGVQARLVSGLCEHAGQHRAGRTLAVRAGHVDEFQLPLGVAHFVQKRADALETGDTALPADGMDIIQRFVKRHDGSLLYVSDFFSYLTGGQSLAAVNTLDLYSSHTTATSITNVTPNWIDRDASFVRKNAVFASPP